MVGVNKQVVLDVSFFGFDNKRDIVCAQESGYAREAMIEKNVEVRRGQQFQL